MKITRRQLRRIIRESLPYQKGQPWTDPKAPVGDPVERAEDHLDRELTDDEVDAAMGWEPADPAGDEDFWTGYGDAIDGKGLPTGASPDYKAGWEDGKLDRVTEGTARHQLRRIIREVTGGKGWSLGDGRCNSHNIPENEAYEAIAVLQEFGYELGLPMTVDSNNIAIDDALAGYPGEYTYEDFKCAIQVVQGRG